MSQASVSAIAEKKPGNCILSLITSLCHWCGLDGVDDAM